MAEQQVLTCPACGRSGTFARFNIAEDGTPSIERYEYELAVSLRQRNRENGQVFWTHHEVPLQVKLALRQQLVEALAQLDAEIAEAADD